MVRARSFHRRLGIADYSKMSQQEVYFSDMLVSLTYTIERKTKAHKIPVRTLTKSTFNDNGSEWSFEYL